MIGKPKRIEGKLANNNFILSFSDKRTKDV